MAEAQVPHKLLAAPASLPTHQNPSTTSLIDANLTLDADMYVSLTKTLVFNRTSPPPASQSPEMNYDPPQNTIHPVDGSYSWHRKTGVEFIRICTCPSGTDTSRAGISINSIWALGSLPKDFSSVKSAVIYLLAQMLWPEKVILLGI